ncbi:MAG TPA: TadE family protein [Sphingomonadaceae bacterium]
MSLPAQIAHRGLVRGVANLPHALRKDCSGSVLVEFALTAPLWIYLVMSSLDLGQLAYAKSILDGATQDAARNASLETGDTTAADAMVAKQVRRIAPGATVTTSRVSYYDFADIGRPEKWTDKDRDGECDNSEPYTDENGNGQWDADIGKSGNGGADDVVMYTVTVTYDRLFKMPLSPGVSTRTISATAVRKNQPFASQEGYNESAGAAKTCT